MTEPRTVRCQTRLPYTYGTRVFPDIANVLRVSVFASTVENVPWEIDQVMQLRFEIDDQTPEQLAQALDLLRQETGVLDVIQQPTFGKKQRQSFAVTLMVRIEVADEATRRCFELTPTLGIRRERIERAVLRREEIVVLVNAHPYRVKVARRPGGITAKIEMDDLVESNLSQTEQAEVRQMAERLAVEKFVS